MAYQTGQRVEHTNPELADWRGEISPAPRGNRKGTHHEYVPAAKSEGVRGWNYYYVVWTAGDGGNGKLPKAGWYSEEGLRPV